MTDVVNELIRRGGTLEQEFNVVRQQVWAPIAELIRPLRNELRGPKQPGERRDRGLYDSTGINANENCAAGLFGTFCNPADTWFQYSPLEEILNKSVRVQRWCEGETATAHKSLTPVFSQFYSEIFPFLLDGCGLGNAVFYSEERLDYNGLFTGFIDRCLPLSECCWDVNGNNDVDTMYRRWKMPAHAAVRMFRDGCSKNTISCAEKEPNHPVEILHVVLPAETGIARDTLKTNKPFVSVYLEVEEKHEISKGGYWEFPFMVWRWEKAAGEKTGRGRGEVALADMATLNVATRDNIKAGNRAADPPWGAPHEGDINAIRVAPGKITYGAVNQQGKQLLIPLINGSQLPWSLEMANQVREAVRDAFFFTRMQLVGRTGMTATEVMEDREGRLRLLAPYGAGLQNDGLAPFALRRFNMMKRRGMTSPPPPELANRAIQVAFTSPFAMAQKSAAANSTLRTLVAVESISKFDPEIADRVDADAALKTIREGFGAPASILRTDDETERRHEIRRQAQKAALTAEVANKGAGAFQKGAAAVATLRETQAA